MIMLTAYNEDTEGHRLVRLCEVAVELRGKTEAGILELHDCKGELHINWAERPSTQDVVLAAAAWERQGEWAVNHFVGDEELLGDTNWCGGSPFAAKPRLAIAVA